MEIVLAVTTLIAVWVANFYRHKAKENYHLFELSKDYGPTKADAKKLDEAIASMHFSRLPPKLNKDTMYGTKTQKEFNKLVIKATPKLNKDGSIAKKRGRKPKA